MSQRILFHSMAIALLIMTTPDTALRAADPGDAKTAALPGIEQEMTRFVEKGEVAGAVTLVATPEKIVHVNAVGKADIAGDRPMSPDTIVWIASMTKPITGTAIMMLQDEGKLSVDDPVEKYLPEFAQLKDSGGKPVRVTIKHLLTHTSGMGEISNDQARTAKTLADVIPYYVSQPVKFEPGSKWVYCQSGINSAARVVEVVSGESFPDFLERRLFQPLGMKNTTFYLSDEQLPRLSKSYRRTKEKLEETENFILLGRPANSRDRFPAANGGLFSTALDYARFCQMVLNEGEFEGQRYLSPMAVKQMTTIQTGDLKTGFTEGNGWGIGWCVVREPQGPTSALSPGTFGHGGAYGTQAWIDPVKKRAYLLMVQRANFDNADASDVRQVFQELAAKGLTTVGTE